MHRCELHSLTVATKLADVFNAPAAYVNERDPKTDYYFDVEERLYQDYLVEHLGFAGFFAKGVSSDVAKGKTGSGTQVAAELMKKGRWIGHELEQSAYAPLKDLWIYMVGDSTTRQIFTHFGGPVHGQHFGQNSKEWSRERCEPQYPHHRKHHHGGGNFPEEGWSGNCGNNELTCHIMGFGREGILTFDWKHFPYEDYDDWLWGDTGPFGSRPEGINITSTVGHEAYANRSTNHKDHRRRLVAKTMRKNDNDDEEDVAAMRRRLVAGENAHRAGRRPDVLTIQTGLHTCVHAKYHHRDATNHTQIQRYIDDLPRLMDTIKATVARRNSQAPPGTPNTTVIWVTSGRVGHRLEGLPMIEHDECVWLFNTHARRLAHRAGFAVLEREEIERRLLYANANWEKRVPHSEYLRFKMHLEAPAPQIVSTALLHLANCLRNISFFGTKTYSQNPFLLGSE